MQLRLSLTLGIIALSLVGCGRFSLDNSSLDYKQTKTLEPLTVPADLHLRTQQSLYPSPKIDPQALAQAPNFNNKHNTRFQMPRPATDPMQSIATATGNAPSRPEIVTDGNAIPLLKVDGEPDLVWKYVVASVSAANFSAANSKTAHELTIVYEQQNYRLRLTPSGSSNTLGVYDSNNNFVDAKIANEILHTIYQNWPA